MRSRDANGIYHAYIEVEYDGNLRKSEKLESKSGSEIYNCENGTISTAAMAACERLRNH